MKTIAAASIAFFACVTSALAGWESRVVPKEFADGGDRYVLIFGAEEGGSTFESALEELTKAGDIQRLQTLTVHDLVANEDFQKEVFDRMQTVSATALKEAQASAGNMHNPKMIALHQVFVESVMGTATVIGLNRVLEKHGMRIVRPSFEKLELRGEPQSQKFHCALWLKVEPVKQEAEQGGAGQPATRSESDSEGGDKPQPESEGRSR